MLTPRWHKVIRDLWSNKTKTVLVVLAIAVGLFAFGSVYITQDVLVADMDSQYRAVNSANIILYTPSFSPNLLHWVSQQPEVGAAQGQASCMLKMYAAGAGEKTYNLTLIAYQDYQNIQINRITPQNGSWPPGRKEVIFERTSLPLSQLEIGDNLKVELSNGRQFDLKIAGTAHDLNAFPGNMAPLPTAYVSLETLEWMGFSGQPDQINIVTKANINSLPELEKIASSLKQRLQERGFPVYSVQVKDAGEHWAKSVTQSFILILSGLGLFSLILSGFLIVNTITAMVAQQRKQIGMMKAIGGTGRQIVSLYLVLVLFYGLLALLIALPVSLVLGYFFISLVANMLNIDITNFYLPARVLFLDLGAALLVPAVAAIIPILGGVKISVREALADYGIANYTRSGLFDRMLLRLNIFSRPVILALRNTFRRKARLALTLGTLTLAGVLFVGVMNIRASLNSEFSNMFTKYYDWEIALGLDGEYPLKSIEARTLDIPGVVAVDSQGTARVQRLKPDGSKSANFSIVGVRPGHNFLKPDIKEGRWLQPGDKNSLVMTSSLAEKMPDVKVGDLIKFKINDRLRDWEIVGIIPQAWDITAYADFDYLTYLQGSAGLTSSVYVRTAQKDGASQAVMASAVESRLKDSGIRVGSSITQQEIVSSNAGQVDFLIYFLLVMAILAAIIGALGLMGMMSLNVMERTREIGVMRSVGAASRVVAGVVILEGLIVGLVSWLIAVPLSIPMSLLFNAMLGNIMFGSPLGFFFSPQGLVIWLLIVMGMALLASLLPAYRAMRMSIRETLAYE